MRIGLFGATLLAACAVSAPEPSGPCDDDGDCVSSESCVDGVCIRRSGSGAACVDEDDDGFGVGLTEDCAACLERGQCAQDCDDSDDAIAPGLPETCDGRDNNCNDEVDEPVPCESVADCTPGPPLLAGCTDQACVYLPPNQEAPGCAEPVECFDGERTASPACL